MVFSPCRIFLQSPLAALNPLVEIAHVEKPRRVTVLRKPDYRQAFPLHDLAQLRGRNGQVLTRWPQAQEPSCRVVPLRHSLHRCSCSSFGNSLGTVTSKPLSRARCERHIGFGNPRTRHLARTAVTLTAGTISTFSFRRAGLR